MEDFVGTNFYCQILLTTTWHESRRKCQEFLSVVLPMLSPCHPSKICIGTFSMYWIVLSALQKKIPFRSCIFLNMCINTEDDECTDTHDTATVCYNYNRQYRNSIQTSAVCYEIHLHDISFNKVNKYIRLNSCPVSSWISYWTTTTFFESTTDNLCIITCSDINHHTA